MLTLHGWMKLPCLSQHHVHMPDKLNRVLFSVLAIPAPSHDMLMRSITSTDNVSGNVNACGGQCPGFLHELPPAIPQPVCTTMEIALLKTACAQKLNNLGVPPIFARGWPLHANDTSLTQNLLGKVPKTPKQLPAQRYVPPKFLKRSDIVVPEVNLFVNVLPWRSPRARHRAPQGNMACTCPDVVHCILQTSRSSHVDVAGQSDTHTIWIVDVDRIA